ncbi:NUDIX hydrolase [Paenibacillus xylaniclasticus]|uniref:NUDIX hydrolase n=1 Tax=Paenibacillus xylaniclasticus TaxID=588083 RepID=UPI000FD79318|nr:MULTISPECIES: NUDIX domain-containing protein [Paenibacillus]GFN30701.1 hypothetical protein PCURB6_09610 [Paenibacillus curdlanolyticus]
MLNYNICFIRQGDQILLLNRDKPYWMGCWNGIGGKLEAGETPRQSMIREIGEEAGIPTSAYRLRFAGLMTWSTLAVDFGGMYTYVAELDDDYKLETPIRMDEGILDWKSVEWIMHPGNQGIATNLPLALPDLLALRRCIDLYTVYEGDMQVEWAIHAIDPIIETDELLRTSYLEQRCRQIATKWNYDMDVIQ